MRTLMLEVSGLHSEGCIEKITQALTNLPGVEDVTVSLLHSKVSVVCDNRLHASRVVNAIDKAGYRAFEWMEDSAALV